MGAACLGRRARAARTFGDARAGERREAACRGVARAAFAALGAGAFAFEALAFEALPFAPFADFGGVASFCARRARFHALRAAADCLRARFASRLASFRRLRARFSSSLAIRTRCLATSACSLARSRGSTGGFCSLPVFFICRSGEAKEDQFHTS